MCDYANVNKLCCRHCFIIGNENSSPSLISILDCPVTYHNGQDRRQLIDAIKTWADVSPYWDVFPKLVELYSALFLVIGKPAPMRIIVLDPATVFPGYDHDRDESDLNRLVQDLSSAIPIGKAVMLLLVVDENICPNLEETYRAGIDIAIDVSKFADDHYTKHCWGRIVSHWHSLQRSMNQKVRNATEAISYFAIAFVVVPLIANIVSSTWQLLAGPQLVVFLLFAVYCPIFCLAFRINCGNLIRRFFCALCRRDISRIALFLLGALTVLNLVILYSLLRRALS